MLNPYFAFGVPAFLLVLYAAFALFRRSSDIPYLGFVLFIIAGFLTGFSLQVIQQAINEVSEAGGGTVVIPEGVWMTGPIELKSNVRLYADKSSLIVFSSDYTLYPIIETSFEGLDTRRCTSPIWAKGAKNIAITGQGVFNGSGQDWRPLKRSKVTASQWKAFPEALHKPHSRPPG